jgi:hypothetical protein
MDALISRGAYLKSLATTITEVAAEDVVSELMDSAKILDDFANERLKKELEITKDLNRRIEIQRKLIRLEIEAEQEKELAELRDKLAFQDRLKELPKAEEELRALNEQRIAIRQQEMIEQEKEKAGQDAKRTVEKRVDLETSILDALGKQVTTLQQMAMLVQFLDALERRKDARALKSIRELNREQMKLDKMRIAAAADPGGVAARALQGQEGKVGALQGQVDRNKNLAGIGQGNPAGIFNIGAFFATLNAELQNFVNKLKENPVIIPAKFDIESLARDLTEAWKLAKIDGLFSNVPRLNPDGIASNGGATGGNSLVNNDNSTINVNVQRLPDEIARKLAIV